MSHPEYFSRRATKYRELATRILDAECRDELQGLARLFDHMAETVRNHDVGLAHEVHWKIIKALRGALEFRSGEERTLN